MNTYNLDIAIVVPGLPFDGDTIKTKGLGGSETAGYYMARELAALGNHVTMFTNTENPGFYDGVLYVPLDQFQSYISTVPHDVTIVQRAPDVFVNTTNSRLNVLWNHDLALGRNDAKFRGMLWNVDKVAVVSEYMKEQYKDVHKVDDSVFMVTRNGVDLDLIEQVFASFDEPRDPNKLIYAARPERGLDVLVSEIFPRLLEKNPDYKLHIAGYVNPVEHFREFYAQIHNKIAEFGDRVVLLGDLGKEELYKHYLTAGCYVYPTPSPVMPNFNEVSCISAIEAQACGLPIVTTMRGALPETIHPLAGQLIAEGADYIEEFVDSVHAICCDEDDIGSLNAEHGITHAQKYNWSEIAKEWTEEFNRLIQAKTENSDTLVRDFIRKSDICAAKELIKHNPVSDDILDDLEKHYSFMEKPDGYREQYEHIGSTHTKEVFSFTVHEQRLSVLTEFLNHNKEYVNILDWGCAHGSYAIHTSNAIGAGRRVTGVDIDFHGIQIARDYVAEGKAHHPECLTFKTISEFLETNTEKFDCLILQEILEHVPEPWKFLDDLEQHLTRDAKIYITVPYGPWEYDSYFTYPWRAHIWHFDMHDIRDMFSDKADLAIGSLYSGHTQLLDQAAGWWLINFNRNGNPSKPIDMDRKLSLQAPRQTVSANIMAGPNAEDQLLWCLKSLTHVVDEIVIVDTGLNDICKSLIQSYVEESGANIFTVPGSDPKVEGFETPRNQGLEHCDMDWVFWIDTDEKLVDGKALLKYLRENSYNGYGLRQNHFAVDTTFSPDMPVRLFRNRPYNRQNMRYFGMIHEHPELELNKGPGPVIVLSDAQIAHTGYLTENIRRARFNRNYPLLEKDKQVYPDRVLQKHFMMRDNMLSCTYLLQMMGGQITHQMRELAQQTVDIYHEHFIGKNHYANVDSVQWYSQALELLGEGVTISYAFAAGKDDVLPGESRVLRYASKERFIEDMLPQIDSAIEPLEHEYY